MSGIIKSYLCKAGPRILSDDELQVKEAENQLKFARKQLNRVQKRGIKPEQDWQGRVERARAFFIITAFELKSENKDYKLPPEVQKVFKVAQEISHVNIGKPEILAHGEEYAFLTDKRHFLDKHILTLKKWRREHRSSKSSLVKKDDIGHLILATYSKKNRKTTHLVSQLMNDATDDRELTYNLDYFGLHEERKGDIVTELRPNFKVKGDDIFHVSIVTDCPTNTLSSAGHHTWLRLIDARGRVYSTGKFPTYINGVYLFEKVPVVYKNSDKHEWLMRHDTIKEHKFELTHGEFNSLKARIEADYRSVKDQDFLFFNQNCSDWAVEYVSEFYKEIEKKKTQVDGFSILFKTVWSIYTKCTPSFIKRIVSPIKKIASRIFLQLPRYTLIRLLGGTRKPKREGSKSYLEETTWLGSITNVTHPYKLRRWLNENHIRIQRRNP
ncbi:MAG: hypothetical protein K940chlam3_00570 [Chlamydiae bacterium]|nr:hypothetical protein [Chlamydiota bacterium]